MADAPASLGDFFANKKKKVLNKTNLNNVGTEKADAKPEKKKAAAGDDEWEEKEEEPNIVVPQIKVAQDLLGRLDKPAEEETAAEVEEDTKPVWGKAAKADDEDKAVNSRRFPTLASATRSKGESAEEQEERMNENRLKKNAYAGLQNEEDDEEEAEKKKKKKEESMRAAKKQGERETASEDAKPSSSGPTKTALKKEKKEREAAEQAAKEAEKEKKEEAGKEGTVEDHPDLKIKPDEDAIRAKFEGRKKLKPKPLDPRDVGGG